MQIKTFYDKNTFTFSYIIICEKSNKCAIIDSVLDYNQYSGKIATTNVDKMIAYIKNNNLQNEWILETHIHADHLTASHYLKEHIGGKIAMGSKVKTVIDFWAPIYNFAKQNNSFDYINKNFDHLFEDNEKFRIGELEFVFWKTPGHTPACGCYYGCNKIFVGDTVFSPSIGTARCDFPGGSIATLYESIQRIYALPDDVEIYLCHDYPQDGNEPMSVITVGRSKIENAMLKYDDSFEVFAEKRSERDSKLSVPNLILPSLQFNLYAGNFHESEDNGILYFKIPLNKL